MSVVVAPSILASDFANLASECRDVLGKGAAWLHCDVMDGHFVPNISLGAPVVASLRKALGPDAFLDCHLMVSDPARWAGDFARAGANMFTFHAECFDGAEGAAAMAALCRSVRAEHRMLVGVSVKPATPVEAVFALVEAGLVDMVLVMTVEPGFGGQSFMAGMLSKVAALRAKFGPSLRIQVDGGVDLATAPAALRAGADVLVAGTAVFRAADRAKAIAGIRDGTGVPSSL